MTSSLTTISWGEIINQVREIHIKFYQAFPYDFQEVELRNKFEFPATLDAYTDWEPLEIPRNLDDQAIDAIELHAVERKLLEGALSPNEHISISNENELSFVMKQILMLEREWLMQMNLLRPEVQTYLEQSVLRMQNSLSGKPRLQAL